MACNSEKAGRRGKRTEICFSGVGEFCETQFIGKGLPFTL